MKTTIKNKIKIGLIILGMGGTLVVGNQAGRPDCDYVITSIDATMAEVCLTAEQAEVFLKRMQNLNAGFGGIQFGGGISTETIIKEK